MLIDPYVLQPLAIRCTRDRIVKRGTILSFYSRSRVWSAYKGLRKVHGRRNGAEISLSGKTSLRLIRHASCCIHLLNVSLQIRNIYYRRQPRVSRRFLTLDFKIHFIFMNRRIEKENSALSTDRFSIREEKIEFYFYFFFSIKINFFKQWFFKQTGGKCLN